MDLSKVNGINLTTTKDLGKISVNSENKIVTFNNLFFFDTSSKMKISVYGLSSSNNTYIQGAFKLILNSDYGSYTYTTSSIKFGSGGNTSGLFFALVPWTKYNSIEIYFILKEDLWNLLYNSNLGIKILNEGYFFTY